MYLKEINFKEMVPMIEGTFKSKICSTGIDASASRQNFFTQGNLSFAFKAFQLIGSGPPTLWRIIFA